MKKNNSKRLFFVGNNWLKLLLTTSLCFLILICFTTSGFAADPFLKHNDESVDASMETNNRDDAQQLTVKGTVADAETGETLPAVTIQVLGTTLGTFTDFDGKFTINVPDRNAVLSFSYVGYKPIELAAVFGSEMNVALEQEVTKLKDVVVVGYGVQKKESVVGAIAQVENKELLKSASSNITNVISGKLSGVLTIQQSGEPGSNEAEILIRGVSSWNSSQPLTLVDGVERDFNELDPNEIATISVLKDASATAVFGAKGANGVIIVTTKRGSIGKPVMEFSTSYGMEFPTNIPDHVPGYKAMQTLNVALMNGQQYPRLVSAADIEEWRNPSSRLSTLQYPDVDWFKAVKGSFGPTYNANFNVSGGTNFSKYFISLGYNSQGDFFDSFHEGKVDHRLWYKRFNYRANVDFALTKTTQLAFNFGGAVGIRNNASVGGTWYYLYNAPQYQFPAYFPSWVLDEVPDPDYPDATGERAAHNTASVFQNPYSIVNNGDVNRQLTSDLNTDLILNQKLDFITKGLAFNGKVSLNTQYQNRVVGLTYRRNPGYELRFDRIGTDQNPWIRTGEEPPIFRVEDIDQVRFTGGDAGAFRRELYYEFSVNYSRKFGNHNVTALALMNRQERTINVDFPFYNEALVGRATYDFKGKYLVELNVGYTGSERFAPGNRFGFFPSGAVGWVVSDENFFKNSVPWMNRLKIRYSDGLVGSDYAENRFLYIGDYSRNTTPNTPYWFVLSGQENPTDLISEDFIPNTSAQWEEAHKRDIGAEIGIFKNLFTFNVDYFDERRSKILMAPNSEFFILGNQNKELNIGKVKKHGFEIEAEFNKTTRSKLNYYVRGNVSFSENRIVFRDDTEDTPDYKKYAGKPISPAFGSELVGTGFLTSVDDIHNNPKPEIDISLISIGDYRYLDYDNDGVLSDVGDDFPIKGLSNAPLIFSIGSGASYKNFTLSVMFQGTHGKYSSFVYEEEFRGGELSLWGHHLDYWTPDNQDATQSTVHYATASLSSGYGGSLIGHNWRKSDYIRLKEIFFGYNFKSAYLEQIAGISNVQLFANMYDLLTWTSFPKIVDPENEGSDNYYPVMKSIRFGLKVGF